MIRIRKAELSDKEAFSELVLLSAYYFPILFGKRAKTVFQELFCHPSNLFSFEHVIFADVNRERAGMILGYDWQTKKRENFRTGFLFFIKTHGDIILKIPQLIRFHNTVGDLREGGYYISNVAVYPQYRGMGLGKRLILEIEEETKNMGAEKIVLDVEKDNFGAIKFYEKLGFGVVKEFSVKLQKNEILQFYRMAKEL